MYALHDVVILSRNYIPKGRIVADISYCLPWTVTIGVFLKDVVDKDPDKVYLYYKDNSITYKEFYENSRKAAQMYWNLGVRHGDRVSMFMPNGLEILYLSLIHI